MDSRAAKLAIARKKLKDHQEKKMVSSHKDDTVINQHNVDDREHTISYDIIPDAPDNNCQNSNETGNVDGDNLKDMPEAEILDPTVNLTEILVASKRNLETQISVLQSKVIQLEQNQMLLVNENHIYKHQIHSLEDQLKSLNDKYSVACDDISLKNKTITEYYATKTTLMDDNNNLQEQLEFTKSVLTSKELENSYLHSQLSNLQNQFDVTQLQLQQLTNGSNINLTPNSENSTINHNSEMLTQKVASLEQQLKTLQKEKDQMNLHYEHYVTELNEQLKSMVIRNDELVKEVQTLSNRENGLVDQISDMEIRLQNYRSKHDPISEKLQDNTNLVELQQNYETIKASFQELSNKYDDIQTMYAESERKVKELSQIKETELNNDNLSISKLQADIASDKIAVQRATEQNKKLKYDLQELEQAFVKISRDKLEFTEKLDAEKFLNRELTIKLAEMQEKANDMTTKLFAKDEEMIRLQSSYREIKLCYEKLQEQCAVNNDYKDQPICIEPKTESVELGNEIKEVECEHEHLLNTPVEIIVPNEKMINNLRIPKEDAMLKLQDRFLKIMAEVADLSDEKHRLEHIILQLQNETDTICEYVALYQQQRSLLNKRDEERNTQIKLFQSECDLLKKHLEELSNILIRLSEDSELSKYFQVAARRSDITKVMDLLSNLKNNSIIDPKKQCSELKDFYPCNCCSGKLINV